jgi:precorrin-6A/cobalt-precorrin-6A reductase
VKVLVLGGTTEARRLAERVPVISSLAGRVARPQLPPGEVRVGGFGGVDGLADWLRTERVDVVVDATHPFAATMTRHAAEACGRLGVPLLVLRRSGWTAGPGDRWTRVGSLAEAAAAARGRVLLTTGRQGLAAFTGGDAWFLVRTVDPAQTLPPRAEALLARGPYSVAAELDLMRRYRIDQLITKDSGGSGTAGKLVAARHLGIPVVLVDRPALPPGVRVAATVDAAVDWLSSGPARSGPARSGPARSGPARSGPAQLG